MFPFVNKLNIPCVLQGKRHRGTKVRRARLHRRIDSDARRRIVLLQSSQSCLYWHASMRHCKRQPTAK